MNTTELLTTALIEAIKGGLALGIVTAILDRINQRKLRKQRELEEAVREQEALEAKQAELDDTRRQREREAEALLREELRAEIRSLKQELKEVREEMRAAVERLTKDANVWRDRYYEQLGSAAAAQGELMNVKAELERYNRMRIGGS